MNISRNVIDIRNENLTYMPLSMPFLRFDYDKVIVVISTNFNPERDDKELFEKELNRIHTLTRKRFYDLNVDIFFDKQERITSKYNNNNIVIVRTHFNIKTNNWGIIAETFLDEYYFTYDNEVYLTPKKEGRRTSLKLHLSNQEYIDNYYANNDKVELEKYVDHSKDDWLYFVSPIRFRYICSRYDRLGYKNMNHKERCEKATEKVKDILVEYNASIEYDYFENRFFVSVGNEIIMLDE